MSFVKSSTSLQNETAKPPPIDWPAGRVALVVDPQLQTRRIIANTLRSAAGADVLEAGDGATALMTLSANHRIGLVVCDSALVPCSGFDLLRVIRQEEEPHLRYMPFVMLSAERTASAVIAAQEAGVDAFVAKPFSMITLRAGILRALGSDRALQYRAKTLGGDPSAVYGVLAEPPAG
jgi:two-component system chemotaxis response regulator CheY